MYELKYLTIKPLIQCTLNCDYCSSRQLLFKTTNKKQLSVDDWSNVFKQAKELGTTYLDISGGEPLIYKDLFAVIWEAKRLGFYVSLNTTGFNFSKLALDLERLGLNKVCISLISLDEDKNNDARNGDDYRHAMEAIDVLKNSKIDLALHFILSKYNYDQVPQIIEFAYASKAASLSFAYPEDDHARFELLLNKPQIDSFLSDVVPIARKTHEALRLFDEEFPIFFDGNGVDAEYDKGIYWSSFKEAHRKCDKPFNFLLIYPDGNVYPCNGIEYTHSPVLGNVLEDQLEHIWSNSTMEQFRREKIDFCRNCPIKRHVGMPIMKKTIPPYSQEAFLMVPGNLPKDRPLSVYKHLKVE